MNTVNTSSLFSALSLANPLYILPKDHLSEDVLIPALRATQNLDVMMGYFSSGSFAEIAPGLATFLRHTDAPLRMVISPFLTNHDFNTLSSDEEELAILAQRIFIEDIPDEEKLSCHTLECLAWLIIQKRLLIKIAVMRSALFHPKVWLFQDEDNRVALHGSTNFTRTGLSANREQLTLSRDWKGEEAIYHIERLRLEFNDLWSGGDEDCYVVSLPEAIEKKVIERFKSDEMPKEETFANLWNRAHGFREEIKDEKIGPSQLKIPKQLVYESGEFSHQGEAVKAWLSMNGRGILEMATGAGKTITAMICATKLQEINDSILVVVAAPYVPLVEQWCEEIKEFGIFPVNLTTVGGAEQREREIKQASRRLRMGNSRAEILVVSNDTLNTEKFISSLAGIISKKLLIADECHNLGAESFIADPPTVFDYRLGLSATPIRQYDEKGTNALVAYFGNICFSFTLEQAIGKCLTQYDYHVHFVELTEEEMQNWIELTNKISASSWKLKKGQNDPYLDNLLRKRRLVLETASGKLEILADLLDKENLHDLRYTLIYATDKNPEQLEKVNQLLQSRGVLFHQLTNEETAKREKTQKLLASFQDGELQILTAKRVLDEGVNIPQIKLAYILASTTVKRQWVQRRGRLLRKCKAIGKTHAIIHDFVVLPPDTSVTTFDTLDRDARKLVRSELGRVWEFARLSRNGPQRGGPYEAVQHLQELANEKV